MENKKNNTNNTWIIVLLILIILGLVGFICYDKCFNKKLNESGNNVQSQLDNDDTNTIEHNDTNIAQLTMEQMCPGCKFTRKPHLDDSLHVWHYSGKYQTTLTNQQVSNLYTNYKDLIIDSGKSHFLGVVLDNKNKIVRAFACGVINDVPFCLEGAANDQSGGNKETRTKVIENNIAVLKTQNLWNGACDFSDGTFARCTGELDVYVDDWCYTVVSDESIKSEHHGGGIECRVDYDGQLYCL